MIFPLWPLIPAKYSRFIWWICLIQWHQPQPPKVYPGPPPKLFQKKRIFFCKYVYDRYIGTIPVLPQRCRSQMEGRLISNTACSRYEKKILIYVINTSLGVTNAGQTATWLLTSVLEFCDVITSWFCHWNVCSISTQLPNFILVSQSVFDQLDETNKVNWREPAMRNLTYENLCGNRC